MKSTSTLCSWHSRPARCSSVTLLEVGAPSAPVAPAARVSWWGHGFRYTRLRYQLDPRLLPLDFCNGPNHNNPSRHSHPFNDNRCFFILFFSRRQLKLKFELLNPNLYDRRYGFPGNALHYLCKQRPIQSRLNTQVPERMLTVYADLDWDIAAQGESLPKYASSWLWDEIRLTPGWKDNGLATLLILRQEPFFEGGRKKLQMPIICAVWRKYADASSSGFSRLARTT